MTESRVGDVHLALRLPSVLAGDAARIRAQLEQQVVVGVLEGLERRLHAALGREAVICIRHIALRWQLEADALADEGVVQRLADELADELLPALAAQPDDERLRPRSSVLVAFADRHHATAAWLADVADGQADRWFHAGRADVAATWRAVIADGPSALAAVLGWLERMSRRAAALEAAPDEALALAASLGPAVAGEVAVVQARRAVLAGSAPRPRETTPGEPAAPGEPTRAAGQGEAPSHATAAVDGTPRSPATALEGPRGSSVSPEVPVSPAATDARVTPVTPVTRQGHDARDGASRAASPPTLSDGPESPAAVAPLAGDAPAEHGRTDGLAADTAYAGLFYLVGRVLEIELAEQLWAAGIDEGAVLAEVARAILDDDGDPSWRWFGGGADRVVAPPVAADWAAAEVTTAVQHSLGRRLVRFGITTTPDALAAELDDIAATLPQDRAPADPVLARLVRRAVAALAVLVGARLGEPPSVAALRAVVRRPGRLVITADELRVILPAAVVELDHRRAGLDQNPGHAPWLGRRVVLEFVGGETL